MNVIFQSRDRQARISSREASERIQFVMQRLAAMVSTARVKLTDQNGPRGGKDKHCVLTLNTDFGTVVTSATNTNGYAALDVALSKALRVLKKMTTRQRTWRRTAIPQDFSVE